MNLFPTCKFPNAESYTEPRFAFRPDSLAPHCRFKIGNLQLAIETLVVIINLKLAIDATRSQIVYRLTSVQDLVVLELQSPPSD